MRQEVNIKQDGPRVLLAYKGLEIVMSAASARAIARALQMQAGRAEEIENHEQAVFDQAILYRVGAGIGLLHNRSLRQDAVREAAWNSNLRRYMPGGVKSTSIVGTPALIQSPPKEQPNGRS